MTPDDAALYANFLMLRAIAAVFMIVGVCGIVQTGLDWWEGR